jgi:hypothetical protein
LKFGLEPPNASAQALNSHNRVDFGTSASVPCAIVANR